jgi:hypothetical protein
VVHDSQNERKSAGNDLSKAPGGYHVWIKQDGRQAYQLIVHLRVQNPPAEPTFVRWLGVYQADGETKKISEEEKTSE